LIDRTNRYAEELEAEIARLELGVTSTPSPIIERASLDQTFNNSPFDNRSTDIDLDIDEIFHWQQQQQEEIQQQSPKDEGDGELSQIIQGISNVSLSATTQNNSTSSHQSQNVLLTIILSAAIPGDLLQPANTAPKAMSLPPKDVIERVIHWYIKDKLPSIPFISSRRLLHALQVANGQIHEENPSYSIFLIGCLVATTALTISPTSLTTALQLHRYAVTHLINAIVANPVDILRDLESVVALTQFAAIVSDALLVAEAELLTEEVSISLPDLWALSGIGVRIAVDYGLHKFARNEGEYNLFQAALALEKRASIACGGLPMGIAEATIEIK
jgi:hypothetical protein